MIVLALPASTALPNHDRTLLWAVLASLALHALIGLLLPILKMELPEPTPQTLQVELAPPPKAAPVTAAHEPEAIPEPVKPPEPPPPPLPKPTPIPLPAKPEPPRPEPPKPAPKVAEPVAKPQEQAVATPSPEVISVAPKESVAPPVPAPAPVAPPAPAPTPAPPPGPSQQDIDAARSQYSSLLARTIGKYKQYPKIAQMRGWQGEVLLEVHCDAQGNVVQTLVKQSSGHNVLDEQAMTMVKKASPLPPAPEVLKNRTLILLVPVPFTLEES